MRRLLPYPVMSATLLATWLLLANAISPGQVLLGVVLALLIPRLTRDFIPARPPLARPGRIALLAARLTFDIVQANFVVAGVILRPGVQPRPGFVRFPLELRDELAITLLASMISLTPGTVSADLSADRKVLLVHALNVTDEAVLIAHIKQRYERPLRELFGC